jgi:hypothetical protein
VLQGLARCAGGAPHADVRSVAPHRRAERKEEREEEREEGQRQEEARRGVGLGRDARPICTYKEEEGGHEPAPR